MEPPPPAGENSYTQVAYPIIPSSFDLTVLSAMFVLVKGFYSKDYSPQQGGALDPLTSAGLTGAVRYSRHTERRQTDCRSSGSNQTDNSG